VGIHYLHEYTRPFTIEGTRPETVLVLHGWTGSPAHFRLMAAVLADHGYGVSAPLLSGHGTDVEHMVGTGWRDWLRDAATAADAVTGSGDRLHIVGLSMGGLLGLLIAPSFGAATLTTINAPLRVYSRRARVAWLARGSGRILDEEPPEPYDEEAQPYAHQYDASPVGTVAELFDLVRASRASLSRVTCPTLIVQSRVDETVRPGSAEIIRDGIAADDKRILWLERSRHVALLDGERDLIVRAVLDLLGRHAVGPETA
jgi:carboxylesterase